MSILSLIFILGLQLFACKPDDEAPKSKGIDTLDTIVQEHKDFKLIRYQRMGLR